MTLRRQLLLVIAFLFVLMFVGTLAISVGTTRNYLLNQLESHAQDTATSLGLSLSAHARNNDLPTMNSMVDAIFDRGYYREIVLEAVDGQPLITRSQEVAVEGVPGWFVRAIPLDTPRREAMVMAGWKVAAKVYVSSHPGYAYRKLWTSAAETFWWFLGVAAATLALGFAMLHFVLGALRAVERQAEAISAREYPVQEKLPRTRELRRMVEVMNKMSVKVKQMFLEQAALTEKMRSEAAIDPVTGLGNRRYFNAQLENLIHSPEEFFRGALFLIELKDFKRYNDTSGYQAGDHLLQEAAMLLGRGAEQASGALLARLAGASFAMLAPSLDAEEAGKVAQRLSETLRPLQAYGLDDSWEIAHIGATLFRKGLSASELLAAADLALRAAQQKGRLAWQLHEGEPTPAAGVRGRTYWSERLREVIARENIVLHFQPVQLFAKPSVLHHEVLLRITGEAGELLPAGSFMPMAESLGLALALDRLVVKQLLVRLAAPDHAGKRYAVNLATSSLLDPDFIDWLCAELGKNHQRARRLAFEVPEHEITNRIDPARQAIQRVAALGCQFGIDHCGRGFASFGYLSALKLDYLKIDGGYVRDIAQSKENQFFIESLTKVAHELDLLVVAEAVETQQEYDTLQQLYLDAAQGYFVGRPAPQA